MSSEARDRLAAACEGRPDPVRRVEKDGRGREHVAEDVALCGVRAGDLAEVAGEPGHRGGTAAALRKGARAVQPDAVVYVRADHLRELLAGPAADAAPEPAPEPEPKPARKRGG